MNLRFRFKPENPVRLTADFLSKKEEEKELQKEERLRLKEEEKAQKELDSSNLPARRLKLKR